MDQNGSTTDSIVVIPEESSPTVPDSSSPPRRRCRWSSCGRCITTCLSSSIFVGTLLIAYIFAGGFMFKELELSHEMKTSSPTSSGLATADVITTADAIWQLTQTTLGLNESQLRSNSSSCELRTILRRFQSQTSARAAAIMSPWLPDNNVKMWTRRWSLPGSVLFCVSLLTTVGYADVAPQTPLGRLLTIPYALIGIPLTFYFLSRVGRDLAVVFRSFYHRVCCDLFCCKLCQRRQRQKLYDAAIALTSQNGAINPAYVSNSTLYRLRIEANRELTRQSHVYESIVGDGGIAGRLNVSRAGTSSRSPSVMNHRRLAPVQSDPSVYRLASPLPLLTSTSSEAGTRSLPNRHRLHRTTTAATSSVTTSNRIPRLVIEESADSELTPSRRPGTTNFPNETQSLDRTKLKSKPKLKSLIVASSDVSHSKTNASADDDSRRDFAKKATDKIDTGDRWPATITDASSPHSSDVFPLASFNRRGAGNTTSGIRRPTSRRSSIASFAVRRRAVSPSHRKERSRRMSKSSSVTAKRHISRLSGADQRPFTSGSSTGGCFGDLGRLRSFSRHGSDESFVTAFNATPLSPRKSMNKRQKGELNEDEDDKVLEELDNEDEDDEVIEELDNEDEDDEVIEELDNEDSSKRNSSRARSSSDRRLKQLTIIGATGATELVSKSKERSKMTSGGDVTSSPTVVDCSEHANSTYGVRQKPSSVPLPLCLAIFLAYLFGGAALFVRSRRRCTGSGSTTPVDTTVVDDWYTSAFVTFSALTTIGGWYPLSADCSSTTTDSDNSFDFQWPPDFRYLYSAWLIGGLCLIAMLVRLIIDCVVTGSDPLSCCRCCRGCRDDVVEDVEMMTLSTNN